MPSPEANIDLTDGTGPAVRRYPAAVDHDERFDAIVSRGRSMRRRRVAGRGGAVLGTVATLVVVALVVTGRGDPSTSVITDGDDPVDVATAPVERDLGPTSPTTLPTTPPSTLPVPGCDDPNAACQIMGLSTVDACSDPAVTCSSSLAGTDAPSAAGPSETTVPAAPPAPTTPPSAPPAPPVVNWPTPEQTPPPSGTLVIGDLVDGAIRLTDPRTADYVDAAERICVIASIEAVPTEFGTGGTTVFSEGCSDAADGRDLPLDPWKSIDGAVARTSGLIVGPVNGTVRRDTTLRIGTGWLEPVRAARPLESGQTLQLLVQAWSGIGSGQSDNQTFRTFTLTVP